MEEQQKCEVGTGESKKGGFGKLPILILVILVLVAGYYFWESRGESPAVYNLTASTTAVALVNGEEITRAEYDTYSAQLTSSFKAQGVDVASSTVQDFVKQQTLDSLVSLAVVKQEATKENIQVSDTEVEAALAKTKANFSNSSDFAKAIAAEGFIEATLKESFAKSLLFEKYISAHVNLTAVKATAKEVEDSYNQSIAGSQGKNIPTLAEVRSQIEQEVILQKQQALIGEYLKKIIGSSKVEILI